MNYIAHTEKKGEKSPRTQELQGSVRATKDNDVVLPKEDLTMEGADLDLVESKRSLPKRLFQESEDNTYHHTPVDVAFDNKRVPRDLDFNSNKKQHHHLPPIAGKIDDMIAHEPTTPPILDEYEETGYEGILRREEFDEVFQETSGLDLGDESLKNADDEGDDILENS